MRPSGACAARHGRWGLKWLDRFDCRGTGVSPVKSEASGGDARRCVIQMSKNTTVLQSKGERWESEGKMKKSGKNIEKARKGVESRPYTLQEAVPLLQKVKFAKFDETVEVTLRLGVDPKHADQMVRGTVVLPHGLGKSKKVLVIASGEKM